MFALAKRPDLAAIDKLRRERELLGNVQRGVEMGEFIAVCRTDYTQTFSDPWIERFDYQWSEYLFLIKNLLANPGDLSALVYLPQDLSEVYYVVVPAQAPTIQHLTSKGRQEYEVSPGYEAAVNTQLYDDYASLPKRSVFHSVDPKTTHSWEGSVEDILNNRVNKITIQSEGGRYTYSIPADKEEAEANAFVAIARRYGAYPMEQSLVADQKFDMVPTIPEGRTARITVREFAADPSVKAPFGQLSFQKTELERNTTHEGMPLVHYNISLGNDLSPGQSLAEYLQITYVQLNRTDPDFKILGYS